MSARHRPLFGYAPAIIERYPTIRAGVIHATGLSNGPSPDAFLGEYAVEQRTAAERLDRVAIADLASIAAWRRVFSSFGAKPTQYRNAAEALLRRLGKQGGIGSVNQLVDIGNLVSIRHALPIAVCDQTHVVGGTVVRFATGTENFSDLGSSEGAHPFPGEVIFADDADVVSARRWCWRQSAQSATRPSTTEAVIVVEGHHADAAEDVASALGDLASLLTTYQRNHSAVQYTLSPDNPSTPDRSSPGIE